MRITLPLSLALLVLTPSAPLMWAGDREDALAIVEQGIKAHGGETALAKTRNAVRSGTGNLVLGNDTIPFNDEIIVSLPDRLRIAVELAKRQRMLTVLNGMQAWQNGGGQTMPLADETRNELREELYVWTLTTLLPLKDEGVTLATVGEVMVNGQPALVLKAASKGHRDALLYFDKKSGLLVKAKRRAVEVGVPVDKEYYYGDHKDVEGILLPTRETQYVNGKKFAEVTSATWKILPKADDSAFNRP